MKCSRVFLAIGAALLGPWFVASAANDLPPQAATSPTAVPSAATPRPFRSPKTVLPGRRPPLPDPPQVLIGERLFLETRFAQYFFANAGANANTPLPVGDPVVARTETLGAALPGRFAGMSMNCRVCHLVAEHAPDGKGNRTYADFARRTPVPARPDGKKLTTRHSPAMVNASIPRESAFFLHSDGEFTSGPDLVKATFTGRNFGWLPREQRLAVQHIARIIREDDGQGQLARELGGSYRSVLAGTDPGIPEPFRLPVRFRLDVNRASDDRILDLVAHLVDAYMNSLFFSRDEVGEYDGSPYDLFLEKNRLPRMPEPGQSALYYSRHLVGLIEDLPSPRFITPKDGRFMRLKQEFRFGAEELAGLKLFFKLGSERPRPGREPGPAGNCIACHEAPHFTDFNFHNTGVAQEEYDALHGPGAFGRLLVPGLEERNTHFETYLPATGRHPEARGLFLAIPESGQPECADLGLWNVFGNPDLPSCQPALRQLLARDAQGESDAALLPRTLGLFKTPSVRGLGLSEPYLHTGRKDSLEEVIQFYLTCARLAREGLLRNGAPELKQIRLSPEEVAPLVAFLKSLNEDYE